MLSPAVATTTLSDPGPLCANQTVVLTCSVADGAAIRWTYRGETVGPLLSLSLPPPPDPVPVGGIQFTLTLSSQNSNPLISNLSFTASPDMDGGVVSCQGESGGGFSFDERTLQVEMICKSINCTEKQSCQDSFCKKKFASIQPHPPSQFPF